MWQELRKVQVLSRNLSNKERRVLIWITSFNVIVGLLDLIGVFLFSILTVQLLRSQQFNTVQDQSKDRDVFGEILIKISDLAPIFEKPLIVALIAAILFLSKTIFSGFIMARTYKELASIQTNISMRIAEFLTKFGLSGLPLLDARKFAYMMTNGNFSAITVSLGATIFIFGELSLIVLLFFSMLLFAPLVTIFTVVFFSSIVLVTSKVLTPKIRAYGSLVGQGSIRVSQLAQDLYGSFRLAYVSRHLDSYISSLRESVQSLSKSQGMNLFFSSFPRYLFEFFLVFGGLLIFLASFIIGGVNTAISFLLTFLIVSTRVFPSVIRLLGQLNSLRSGINQSTSIFEIFELQRNLTKVDTCSLQLSTPARKMDLAIPPGLSCSSISYRFSPSDQLTFHDLNLHVDAATVTLIQGISGSGKSTLADLILGLREPNEGSVFIEVQGMSLKPEGVGKGMAFVTQHTMIFNESLRFNLLFGLSEAEKREVSDLEIFQLLGEFNLDDRFGTFEDLTDTSINLGDVLSGGQKQRIGMIRALLSKPKLLLLDEVTSALDELNSQLIKRSISLRRSKMTTIVISHDESFSDIADNVFLLKNKSLLRT